MVTVSRYGDIVWDLSPYSGPLNASRHDLMIKFALISEGGRSLLSAENASLLSCAKEYLYVRWMFRSAISGKYLKPRAVLSEWGALKNLIAWMMDHELQRFSEIMPGVAMRYLQSVRERRVGGHYSVRYRMNSVAVVEKIYHSRALLSDALRKHPWPDTGVSIELGFSRLNGSRDARTETIPRRLLSLLGSYVIDQIRTRGPSLLSVWAKLDAEAAVIHSAMLERNNLNKRFRWGRSDLDTWHSMQDAFRDRAAEAAWMIVRESGYGHASKLFAEVDHLRACCYVVCAMFSGMRDSEISSLSPGALRAQSDSTTRITTG
ncbi:hypothetical protein AWV80_00170 [Cupriavidus sp. UYMU48A]|nr:hypothetical protein AWV80_00170 [Cupriavidus sp. UYMU48A]